MALTIERKQQTDLLARAYLDILAAEEGTSAKAMLRRDDPDDPIDMLLDDLSSVSEDKVAIRADYAAGAVLVARAIEAVEGLTRELRRQPRELARIPDAFEIKHDHRGAGILGPIRDKVVVRHVGAIAGRNEA